MTSAPAPELNDTIVAVSSAPGPGLRAIVRISGPAVAAILEALHQPSQPSRPGRFTPGTVRLAGVHSPVPCDCYLFRAPHTYTGQDLAELHLISSPPLVEQLVSQILALGARAARPGEFTLRAFLAGKKDLTRAEAVLAVIHAGSDDDLKAALAQLAGGISAPLERLRTDLLNLLADVEAGLDFVDEDIEFVSNRDILLRLTSAMAQLTNLRRQMDERTVSGRKLSVALVGRPNAGKSSLFNALAGAQAIVSPVPGTTRDYLTAQLTLNDITVELIDTAGLSNADDVIDRASQRLGLERIQSADVILHCTPADEPETHSGHSFGTAIVLTVITKSDCIRTTALSGIPASVIGPPGIEAVRDALAQTLGTLARPALAPSQSRCRHHVDAALTSLRRAHSLALDSDPPELLALELRRSLEEIGSMTGAVYTNDLLDRVFSRFCIGK